MEDLFNFFIKNLIHSLKHSKHLTREYSTLIYIIFLLLGMLIVAIPELLLLLRWITN